MLNTTHWKMRRKVDDFFRKCYNIMKKRRISGFDSFGSATLIAA